MSAFDDIAKLLASQGVKLTKKQILDIKRYARGAARANYLDRKPNVVKLKTAAQKKVAPRLERIEDRRQDKQARLWGDNNGPIDYFFSDKYLSKPQKRLVNQGFSAEGKKAVDNVRKVQKTLGTGPKKKPVKKAPAKKAPAKRAAPKGK